MWRVGVGRGAWCVVRGVWRGRVACGGVWGVGRGPPPWSPRSSASSSRRTIATASRITSSRNPLWACDARGGSCRNAGARVTVVHSHHRQAWRVSTRHWPRATSSAIPLCATVHDNLSAAGWVGRGGAERGRAGKEGDPTRNQHTVTYPWRQWRAAPSPPQPAPTRARTSPPTPPIHIIVLSVWWEDVGGGQGEWGCQGGEQCVRQWSHPVISLGTASQPPRRCSPPQRRPARHPPQRGCT